MNDPTDEEDEAKPSPAPMSVEQALELAERVMAAEAAGSAIEDILAEGSADSGSPRARADEAPGPLDSGAVRIEGAGATSEPSTFEPSAAPIATVRPAAPTATVRVVDPRSANPKGPRHDPKGPRHGRPAHERGGRPGLQRGASPPAGQELTNVKKVRSPFGTRVARKITCGACGAEDTIHFAPRKGQAPMCRRCAAERLGVIDRDANIGPEKRQKCDRCGLFVKMACTYEDPLDCPEHARALAFRQQDRARTGTRSKKNVIRVRRADVEDA